MARGKLKHGVQYEGTAHEKYHDILKYKFQRHVKVKESGFVINPSLFWLGASPDGFVVDGIPTDLKMGLIEIKCPEAKKIAHQQRQCKIVDYILSWSMGNRNLKSITVVDITAKCNCNLA